MGHRKSRNPIGFTQLPVTIITTVVYIALAVALLYVHLVVPSAPNTPVPVKGINITEAWQDLQTLSASFHPYNSHANEEVRSWLLKKVYGILEENGVTYETRDHHREKLTHVGADEPAKPKSVLVFDDTMANFTAPTGPLSVYFEGTNIIVYVRGSEDGEDWWMNPRSSVNDDRGVLVNAHYDSVSTGFGATDDGVGVVSVLQLIKYFTSPGNQPKRGLVALLNNGEEDWLNGARAFMQNPISRFPDTFLNLEGAGAGGRAALFRSTDTEVTKAYKQSPYPFGTVVTGDGFNRGLVRSQTDYAIFAGELGIRGLDVAFFEPRARYHTSEDAARYTSKNSLWHMLSAALATTLSLTTDIKTNFESSKGTNAVWFDLLGRIFGLVQLHTMFAISVSLLVVAPIILIALTFILGKVDKWYLFARKARSDPLDPRYPDDEVYVQLNGWRGLFRYPFAFVLASAAVAGLALLIAKVNPYIIYSSQYAIWSMMLSAWLVVAWFILRGADYMRPTALHRAHAFGWLFFLFWVLLALDTVGENNFKVAGGYPMVIYFAAIFLALFISYLEFFGLPRRHEYVQAISHSGSRSRPLSSRRGPSSVRSGAGERADATTARDVDDPSETTSLLSKKHTPYSRDSRRRSIDDHDESDEEVEQPLPNGKAPYGDEQTWSGTLPSWVWILQFLILGPIIFIIIGQIGLFLTSALHETLADGNGALFIYCAIAVLTVLLLIPVSPFLHRFSFRIPTFIFLVFVGTLLYNLFAFPFSENNRLKVYFSQDLDLSSGTNKVSLTGLDGYVQEVIATLPSAAGQDIHCYDAVDHWVGLQTCTWSGLAPNTVPYLAKSYKNWISVNATRTNTTTVNEAVFAITGQNTKACKLLFDTPISDFEVKDAAQKDERFPGVSKEGSNEIRLWRRGWTKPWSVHVEWEEADNEGGKGRKGKNERPWKRTALEGKAVCLWSDANELGTIPALDEVKAYLPIWAAVSKARDGLVEGSKSFKI